MWGGSGGGGVQVEAKLSLFGSVRTSWGRGGPFSELKGISKAGISD